MGVELIEALSRIGSTLNYVDAQVTSVLFELQKQHRFPFIGRFKAEQSVLQKIETGRYRSFFELDDLIAYSIIIPNLSFENLVLERLKSVFNVRAVRDRQSAYRHPRSFDFDATRVYASLGASDPSGTGLPLINDILFEVQIRSAFEHAWVTAVHSEVYKSNQVDLRKMRLSAEIKAQIESLDRMLIDFGDLSSKVTVAKWDGYNYQIALIEYLQELFRDGIVSGTVMPQDLRRESENIVGLFGGAKIPAEQFNESLRLVRQQVVTHGATLFPESISIYQSFAALLKATGRLKLNPKSYFHATREALTLLPELGQLGPKFDYRLADF